MESFANTEAAAQATAERIVTDKAKTKLDWEKTKNRILDVILPEANTDSPEYTASPETRFMQRQLLKLLPANLLQQLEGHLIASEIDQEARGEVGNFNPEKVIVGELFERLVEAQYTKIDESKLKKTITESQRALIAEHNGTIPDQTLEQREAADTLLAAMQSPGRFGVENNSFRNPDLVRIHFNTDGSYTVTMAIEAKTHLDKRSLDQLSEAGFKRAIQRFDHFLHQIDPARISDHNPLKKLLRRGMHIRPDDSFAQSLVTPRDADLSFDSHFIDTRMEEQDRAKLLGLLTQSPDIRIVKSPFSGPEIRAIAKELYAQILENRKGSTKK